MQNHNYDTIKTSDTVLLEKCTSHFIERVVCERELETEQNCNILISTPMAATAFLSRSPGLLNRGPGGPAPLGTCSSIQHLISNSSDPQLVWSPNWLNFLFTELYNSSTSTFFLRASQFRSHLTSPRSRL